jgi:hypothetical protein
MTMNPATLPWAGGCRCGEVRIEVREAPLLSTACHCAGCRTMSSSAFSLTLVVPAGGFRIVSGEPVVGGLHGPQAHHFFCPRCMTWMFTRAEGFDWFVNVRPSMLDEHRGFAPFIETCASEKLPWAVTPAAHSFDGFPPPEAYEDLMKEYAEQQGEGIRR